MKVVESGQQRLPVYSQQSSVFLILHTDRSFLNAQVRVTWVFLKEISDVHEVTAEDGPVVV